MKYFKRWINLPRCLWFNVKVFGWKKGLRLPVYLTGNMRVLRAERGSIQIQAPLRRFMIELGEGGSVGYPANKGTLRILPGGQIIFKGAAYFAAGTMLRVDKGCVMTFGEGVNANKNCSFWCSERVEIGKDCLFGYDVVIRDGDGHTIRYEGRENESVTAPISIGAHCWIGAKASLLKGAVVPPGCVVGYNSVVLSAFEHPRALLGGYPARELRQNVTWEK